MKTSKSVKSTTRPAVRGQIFRPTLEVLEGRLVPTTFWVSNNLPSGAGSLAAAVGQANGSAGNTVAFQNNLQGQTITLNAPLQLLKDMTIDASGAPGVTITGGAGTIFQVQGNDTIIGLIMTGSVGGGVIVQPGASLNLGNDTFFGMTGGAVQNNVGTVTAQGCNFTNDNAASGGAIDNNSGTLTVTGCSFTNDTANGGSGGAIQNTGLLSVQSSTFTGDEAPSTPRSRAWGSR